MFKKSNAQNMYLCFLLVVLGLSVSCKKNKSELDNGDNSTVPETNNLQTATTDRTLLTRDSIFLYAKQTYFWNIGMPSYDNFNPRQYSSNNALLAALKALPSTGGRDKYSFIDDGSVATQLSGVSGDYGFSANFDGSDLLRVKYVYPTSPADQQGLKRGYQIIKINGRVVSRSTQADVDFLNSSIFGTNPSISMTIVKQDDSTKEIVINRGLYNLNPILYTNTYAVGAKKVGYIVFNSFTTNATTALDAAFAKFTNDGITELVVDLRYNGGGSVATSQTFTNLIAPSSQNGKVMFTTYWTKTMQDGLATILQNQKFYYTVNGNKQLVSMFDISYKPTMAAGNQENFAKRGSLNGLTRVYFLVTSGTASASELLINNLKPVMDVKLIGKTTYGKPVGFFSIRIDKNDLYIPQFQTKNQLNQGDYFSGMTVDKDVADDLTKDFGDTSEKMLAQALYYSVNNNFSALARDNNLSSAPATHSAQIEAANEKLDHEFKGMVETRRVKFR